MIDLFTVNSKVGEIVAKFPKASDILKEYRIDFCCGGNRPISEAFTERNLDGKQILERLNDLYQITIEQNNQEKDWTKSSNQEIIEHVVNKHHAFLNSELPALGQYVTKVFRVHGEHHPHLQDVHKLYHNLKTELEQHMIKEEEIVFPLITQYDQNPSIELLNRINEANGSLEDEHEMAGDLLKMLRDVTSDYQLPPGACRTYTLVYQRLEDLESDMFQHIHLENNLLFPRLSKSVS